MQHIGEGVLAVPGDWHNGSINIFTQNPPNNPGLSVTINRDPLPRGVSFEEYATEQVRELATKLHRFKIVHDVLVQVDGRPGRFCEFTWRPDETKNAHQLLLSVLDGPTLINFTVTNVGVMDQATREQMTTMLMSFRFGAAESGMGDS